MAQQTQWFDILAGTGLRLCRPSIASEILTNSELSLFILLFICCKPPPTRKTDSII